MKQVVCITIETDGKESAEKLRRQVKTKGFLEKLNLPEGANQVTEVGVVNPEEPLYVVEDSDGFVDDVFAPAPLSFLSAELIDLCTDNEEDLEAAEKLQAKLLRETDKGRYYRIL